MVLQPLVNGLIFGGIIVLGAVGLTLVYGILRFPNFAHGDMLALGAYFALVFNATFVTILVLPPELLWLGLLLAVAVSMVLMALMGMFLHWSIFKRLRGESLVRPLIASVGLAFVLQNVIRIVWGTSNQNYGIPAQVARVLPFGIRLTDNSIAILVAVVLLVLSVHLILKYTTLGKAMRATSDNWDLARVTGINVQRVVYATWAIGSALAAVAGILLGLWTVIRPIMGFSLLLPMFAAVILGGIGSPYGAMVGGFIIGVAQEGSLPLLFFLSDLETSILPFLLFVIAIAVVFIVVGYWLTKTDRRRQAKYSYITGGALGVVAATVFIGAAFAQVSLLAQFPIFFELGLQQPSAFKPAIGFMILVLVLLILPQGLAGLGEKPRFQEFVKLVSRLPKSAASASRRLVGRMIPRSK
ncbi:MAG: branched-chain amino acid ABC transporter permease [Thermoplasmata archaeon]